MADHFEFLIIGTGQGGKPLALELDKAGKKTAIVERRFVGGTCVNYGCTPTKTMVASGRVAYLARRGADYGVNTGNLSVDLVKVRERKRAIVASFRSGGESSLKEAKNVELIFGDARFTGSKTVAVKLNDGGTRTLSADTVIVNVGGRPVLPPVTGIDQVPTLDSTSIMELDKVPEHLLVLGGGYIGLEFGQMFRRFGSKVSVIQRAPRLLDREDPDVSDEVAKIMRADGLELYLESTAVRAEKDGAGIRLTIKTPSGEKTLSGSQLLAAAGRVPNTDTLGLDQTGLQIDQRGFLPVNEKLETKVKGIYAIGDVNGGPMFTHVSYDDYRILKTNLLEAGNAVTTGRLIPYTVFIDPQLGRVGMTEAEARASGKNIKVAKIPMEWVARALEVDESRGFMKAIVDMDTKHILGAAVLGLEGGEVMAMLQIAIMGKLPYTALENGIFAHPTLAEALNTLFMYM
ncbi:MAG: mercuric reductase [Gemmataceae bacterium]